MSGVVTWRRETRDMWTSSMGDAGTCGRGTRDVTYREAVTLMNIAKV